MRDLWAGHAYAAPGDGSDVEIEPDAPSDGSGSAASTPAAGSADAPPAVEAPVKDPKIAKGWLTAAQLLVTKGDAATKKGKADEAKESYDNAIVAYGKAIDAGDDPNVYFALAALQDKLGNFPEAIRNYRLVAAAPKGVTPAIAKQVPAKLDAATAKVGLVTLVVSPEGTTISLNGTEIGKAPLSGPLVLLPGA